MGFNNQKKHVLSPHLSLATMLAGSLSEERGHAAVEITDYLAGCYIADPIRFLAFWEDSLRCLDALQVECELTDPVMSYQWNLTERIKARAASVECWSCPRSEDLDQYISAASGLTGDALPEVDLPHFLIAVSADQRFAKLFSGFRQDLALERVTRATRK